MALVTLAFLPAYNISTDTEHLADLSAIAKLLMAVGITHG